MGSAGRGVAVGVAEGVAVGRVTKKGMEDPEAAIGRVMAEIYANYPFRAGVDPR